jgi:hypothetical protein
MLSDVAQAKATLPEEDIPALQAIEEMLLQIARQPVQQMRDNGTLPSQMQQQMSGQMQGQGQPGMAGMGGLSQMAPAPNADELGRLLRA